jgi:predicted Rossmann fold nucleotide-binding protein DprA/Smf involved in DNA uptake
MNVLIVCGGRDYNDRNYAYRMIQDTLNKTRFTQDDAFIVSGGALGADSIALAWAVDNEWNAARIPAKWKRDYKKAGPLRNREMLKLALKLAAGEQIVLLAFPGGTGTTW